MGHIIAEVTPVSEIIKLNLQIPHYQRPYRWDEKNVRQLLDDILDCKNAGKTRYRIGSVILHHQEEMPYDIVDGQQRITTIMLMGIICKGAEGLAIPELLKYKHRDSYEHIRANYEFIKNWCADKNKDSLWDYIMNQCEFVKVVVSNLSEAFQMFDSQNGRGKELEAYNLLKAYHIRAMEQNTTSEKIECDKRWEAATQFDATPTIVGDSNIDILKQLFEEQLYRSRIWSKNQSAYKFSKKYIEEFKGFTIDKNHPTEYPFQNPQLLQYLTSKFYKNVLEGTIDTKGRFENGDSENIDPFTNINQTIVNGKSFFDYIETYVEIYKRLFVDIGNYQLSEFKDFYFAYCLDYDCEVENVNTLKQHPNAFRPKGKALRSGDTYLREAYKSLIFVLFDKFGEKGLYEYFKPLYRLVYSNRLSNKQVKYNSVADFPKHIFYQISVAKSLSDLSFLQYKAKNLNKDLDKFTSIKQRIIDFIKDGRTTK